jgi:hypothetical protein
VKIPPRPVLEDEHVNIALDGALNQRNLVDNVRLQTNTVVVEAVDLVLNIVLEQVTVALLETLGKVSELLVEALLVENVGNTDTATSGLCGVCRADTLAGCADVRVS